MANNHNPDHSPFHCPQNSSSSNNNHRSGGIIGFLSETKKRFFNSLKPAKFPHSPSCSFRDDTGRRVPNTLNFPFQPVTASSSLQMDDDIHLEEDALIDGGDIDILERKVTDMEITVKAILIDNGDGNDKSTNNDVLKPQSNANLLDGLDATGNPNMPYGKIPIDLYHELISAYECELMNENSKPQTHSSVDRCRDKDKNLRSEVLKWNKDK